MDTHNADRTAGVEIYQLRGQHKAVQTRKLPSAQTKGTCKKSGYFKQENETQSLRSRVIRHKGHQQ